MNVSLDAQVGHPFGRYRVGDRGSRRAELGVCAVPCAGPDGRRLCGACGRRSARVSRSTRRGSPGARSMGLARPRARRPQRVVHPVAGRRSGVAVPRGWRVRAGPLDLERRACAPPSQRGGAAARGPRPRGAVEDLQRLLRVRARAAACRRLLWLLWRHRDQYTQWRNLVVGFTGVSLLIGLLPVAPPRLIPGLHMVDLAGRYHQSVYSTLGRASPISCRAVPSVHVGWAVMVAAAVIMVSTSRWRWLAVAHPVITPYVVVVTANHYWLDGVAALAVLGAVSRVAAPIPAQFGTVISMTSLAAPYPPVAGPTDRPPAAGFGCVTEQHAGLPPDSSSTGANLMTGMPKASRYTAFPPIDLPDRTWPNPSSRAAAVVQRRPP